MSSTLYWSEGQCDYWGHFYGGDILFTIFQRYCSTDGAERFTLVKGISADDGEDAPNLGVFETLEGAMAHAQMLVVTK